MDQLTDHLHDRQLAEYLLGQLPDGEQQVVEDHLAECPECEDRAAEATPRDALVDLLHRAAVNSGPASAFSAFGNTLSSRIDSTPGDHPSTIFSEGFVAGASATLPPMLNGHSRYRVLRLLGHGGMGSVWLAEHLVMGRPVALKVIRPELLAKSGTLERFRREVQAAAKLNHPHIAHAYDAEQIGDSHFLVMEYVAGHTLAERVKSGSLPIADACRAVRDAALGLAHAHEAGLVHRDVKPGNLIQTDDGTVKVLDFGLAISAEADSSITGENLVMGTPDYVAPEQAEDPHAADARSDIYGLGCTLYHLLAGRVPFAAESMVKKIDAHRFRDPEPIADVPQELWLIVAKMMAKQPSQRFQTALEVADTLERFCHDSLVGIPIDSCSDTNPTRERGHAAGPRLRVGLVSVLALFAMLLGVVVYRIQTDKGELVITAAEDVEVSVKRGGKEVALYDTKSKQKLVLDSGEYDLVIKGQPSDLKLDIETATIKRGDVFLARVERIAKRIERPLDDVASKASVDVGVETTLKLDPQTPELKLVRKVDWDRHVFATRFSPKGTYYAAGGERLPTSTIKVWETKTGNEIAAFPGASAMAFSQDEKVFMTATHDFVIRAWNLSTRERIQEFRGHTNDIYRDPFLSEDGETLISSGLDKTVRFWETKSNRQVDLIEFPESAALCLCPTLDAKRTMAYDETGNDPELRLLDVATRKVIQRWRNPDHSSVYAVKIAEDGQKFLTVQGNPLRVVFWSTDTDRPKRSLRLPPLCAGTAISRDLNWLLVGNNLESAVYLFNLVTGRVHGRFGIHHGALGEHALSPDGRFAVFGITGPTTIYVFEMPEEVWKK